MSFRVPSVTDDAPQDIPISPVVVSGDLVYVSGRVAFDTVGQVASDEFVGQARQTLVNLVNCLRAAGCSSRDVIKCNIYLANFDDYEELNAIYTSYFEPPFPARTVVQAGLGGLLIEIDAIARLPSQDAKMTRTR